MPFPMSFVLISRCTVVPANFVCLRCLSSKMTTRKWRTVGDCTELLTAIMYERLAGRVRHLARLTVLLA